MGGHTRSESLAALPSTAATGSNKTKWEFGSALRSMSDVDGSTDSRSRSSGNNNNNSSSSSTTTISPLTSSPPVKSDNYHSEFGYRDNPTERAQAPFEVSAHNENNHRLLRQYIQRLRGSKGLDVEPGVVDTAFEEYERIKGPCSSLVRALLMSTPRPRNVQDTIPRAELMGSTTERLASLSVADDDDDDDDDNMDGLGSSFGGMKIEDKEPSGRQNTGGSDRGANGAWLGAIQDWKTTLEDLIETHRTSLVDTYRAYGENAAPEVIEKLFANPNFRADAIHRMKNASAYKMFGSALGYWPEYEARFRNCEQLKKDLAEVTSLLQAEGSGISLDRAIKEYAIAPRGDAILEFANTEMNWKPVFRFRVSSYVLAETSPIFARMFSSHPEDLGCSSWSWDSAELEKHLPASESATRPVIVRGGVQVRLYRMPQLELNEHESLAILLHAAHMHNNKVPRDVTFEQFVSIAEVCMKYRCTSPLEVFVEHRWLPAWIHKANEDMPDGLLLISYAFGLRRLFTRMSKTAILNIVHDKHIQSKAWPQAMKDKIWAVRNAKMAQVHAACTSAIQEYFRPPDSASNRQNTPAMGPLTVMTPVTSPGYVSMRASMFPATPPVGNSPNYMQYLSLSSTPRCPKGYHWCDATNLGWMLLVYNEMQLLETVLSPSALQSIPNSQPSSPRSLAQILNVLRSIPSPPHPVHASAGALGSVCDPAPAFRSAANDVYNSITGLTLFDIDGRQHGWALSRHKIHDPQAVLQVGVGMPGESVVDKSGNASRKTDGYTEHHIPVAFSPDGAVCLRILSCMDNFEDLHAVAMTSRALYGAFKDNELSLMRRVVKTGRRRTMTSLAGGGISAPKVQSEGIIWKEGTWKSIEHPEAGDAPVKHSPIMDEVVNNATTPESHDTFTLSAALGMEDGRDEPGDHYQMTEEEARNILWPDVDEVLPIETCPVETNRYVPSEPGEEMVKYRLHNLSVIEDKTLVMLESKQLRNDFDRRKGLLTSCSHSDIR